MFMIYIFPTTKRYKMCQGNSTFAWARGGKKKEFRKVVTAGLREKKAAN